MNQTQQTNALIYMARFILVSLLSVLLFILVIASSYVNIFLFYFVAFVWGIFIVICFHEGSGFFAYVMHRVKKK